MKKLYFVLLLYSSCSHLDYVEWNCNREINTLKKQFHHGVIQEKMLIDTHHGDRVIKLDTLNSKSQFYINSSHSIYNDFWEQIQIGDTLFKNVDSTRVYVKGKDIDTVFNISCEKFLEQVKQRLEKEKSKK
ncbi:hypothetical protein R9C00_13465 [Flammeovirgaceae bacterium SG7u.111]|nr:hypothetical protein [Flammeovirgaceae bacterium SG7u.132]WPO38466.1 hypothetical protein R9C00_13465 [Flammeovirgaceae bacterium SG7u.111]